MKSFRPEEYILRFVGTGRISIGRAAELLRTSVQDMYRLAEKHGMSMSATKEQQEKSLKTAGKLFRK